MNIPRSLTTTLLAAGLLSCVGQLHAQTTLPDRHASVKQEIGLAISRATAWLKTQQNAETGAWSLPDEPAITGLVVTAFVGDPNHTQGSPQPAEVDKGYKFLLTKVQPDGGIYSKGRANYNTSICLTALVFNAKPEWQQTILRARRFIIGQQNDFDEKGKTDNPFDGGIGYGSHPPPHADLSNTHFALEALYYSKKIFEDSHPEDKKDDLDWNAAITFVQRCQNLKGSNDQPWASDDPAVKGGFIYEPGQSKAGEIKTADGKTALRSYGSISYAGMLSFIYAGVTPDDSRVKAVLKWLGENYSVDENPGLGQKGLYYYFHTMSKALSVADVDNLVTKDGKKVDWKEDLSRKILDTQRSDGSWKNDTGSFMESDPVLDTAYTVLSLEHLYRKL